MNEYRTSCVPLLELKSIAFSYDNLDAQSDAKLALDDISLKVHEGERIIILGHNGSGKSTLAKIMGALQEPLRGTFLLRGRDVREIPFREFHQLVGIVFQDPESQIVGAVVADDVAFAPENQGIPPSEIQKRVDWALDRVGLAYKKNSIVGALSGGEKQRLALAGALAADVKCLILDEPTAMLDPEGRLEIEQTLRSIHASGTALVQVTHQLEFDSGDVDRILVLSGGRLVWQGKPEKFWPCAESLGFELPPLYWMARQLTLTSNAEVECTLRNVTVDSIASAIRTIRTARGDASALNTNLNDMASSSDRTTATHEALIQVQDLSFSFDVNLHSRDKMTRPVLDRVCADIPKDQWFAIIGKTGSGKSTLVQHLNGLYKIQSGKIMIRARGQSQTQEQVPLPQKGRALHELRQRVGLVFQNPEDQFFCPTVREELAFAPMNAGLTGGTLERAILDAIDLLGVSREFLERNPLELSGGEKRLVALASVLSAEPECLVLDEPTAGLDATFRRRLLNLLATLRDRGKTIVTITHDLKMALECSDKILVMQNGRSIIEGTAREILPALMQTLRPEVWPEALQVSAKLELPLEQMTWRPDELVQAIDYI